MAGALGTVSSPLRKVLQSDAESTPVLCGKYWSTLRTGLATGPVITNHTKRWECSAKYLILAAFLDMYSCKTVIEL